MSTRRAVRRRRYLGNAGVLVLSVVLMVWTFVPIYNMVMISLEPEDDVYTDRLWEHFWRQFGNSLYLGAMVTFLTLLFRPAPWDRPRRCIFCR